MASTLLAIALIMAFSVFVLYLNYKDQQSQKINHRMQENLAKLLSSERSAPYSGQDFDHIKPEVAALKLDTLVCRTDGKLSWSSLISSELIKKKADICRDFKRDFENIRENYFFKYHTTENGENYFIYGLRFIRYSEGIPISYDLFMIDTAERYQAQSKAYLYQCVQQALLTYILFIGLLFLTITWSLSSLKIMARELNEIRKGFRYKLSSNYERELKPLTESMNQLLENERHQTQRYLNAMNDLAHSLKTRLALIQLTMEDLELRRELNDHINEQIITMDQIIQYQLRRAVSGRKLLANNETDSVLLIEKLLASLSKIYRHKKLQTRFIFEDNVFFHGEPEDLMELMGNLLDNAFKYALHEIKVTASCSHGWLQIEVEDDGPGIPQRESQRIFQRGIRADTSTGQGVGLAVVAEIVQSYNGQISVEKSLSGGAHFKLILP